MNNENKKKIANIIGLVCSFVAGAVCASGGLLIAKKKINKQYESGTIVVYPDDFGNDQLFLEINTSLEDLKSKKYGYFKIVNDKHNKRVQVKENYAKSWSQIKLII